MNIEGLREYLTVLATEGYAKDPGTKNEDGSTTIHHKSDDGVWQTSDTYWGGEPYSGCETVSKNDDPCWTLVYYGQVKPTLKDVETVYGCLKDALSNTDQTFPVRGPENFQKDDLNYKNHWHGDLSKFGGKERILRDGEEIYAAEYMGGYVNIRKG